jgi:multisubunit Na+/H+ antiporter MnhB subunit
MSWTDWSLLAVFIAGFLLFLYGANTYNAIVGYAGIYLFIGSIAAYIIIYVYKELKKKETCEVPAPSSVQPQNP